MIHFITGKPGGGKSLYAMRRLIRELVFGNRDVVTNLPVRRDVLSEYLQRTYPDRLVDLCGPNNRLWLLDDAKEVRELFVLYRYRYNQAKASRKAVEELDAIYTEFEGKIADLPKKVETETFWEFRNPRKLRFDDAVGTLFVLDEVHLYFNARSWQKTGERAISYLSQHRHFSDDVILVTQHADNVDLQFRRLVEDWTVVKNGYRQKLGWFRALPRFSLSVYSHQPTGGSRQAPFETLTFTLDARGVASTYNTASAAGAAGNGADTKKALPGLHPAWFLVFLVTGAVALGAVIKGANVVATSKLSEKLPEKTTEQLVKEASEPIIGQERPIGPSPGQRVHVSEVEKPVFVQGVVKMGGKVNVLLTDGRTLTERDFQSGDFINRSVVRIAGVSYHYQRPKESERSSPRIARDNAVPSSVEASAAIVEDKESAWLPPDRDGVTRLRETPGRAEAFTPSVKVD